MQGYLAGVSEGTRAVDSVSDPVCRFYYDAVNQYAEFAKAVSGYIMAGIHWAMRAKSNPGRDYRPHGLITLIRRWRLLRLGVGKF